MLTGPAGGSVEMRNKRHWDNFIKVHGIFEKFKELIFIVIKFILAIGKKSAKESCLYGIIIDTTPFRWMVDCYSTSQFYHKPVRSCFVL